MPAATLNRTEKRSSLRGLEFVSPQTVERNSVLKDEDKSPSRLVQR